MFDTDASFLEELLSCKIGYEIYTIQENPSGYSVESHTCGGFIIDHYDGKLKIRPAYDTWDGWVPIQDFCNHGYFLSREEAYKKIKELMKMDELSKESEWINGL